MRDHSRCDGERIERFEPAKAVAVGLQRRGQDQGVAPIVLRLRRREAIAKAIELLVIDGEDPDAAVHQRFHHGAMRRLDRHGYELRRWRLATPPIDHHRQYLRLVGERLCIGPSGPRTHT